MNIEAKTLLIEILNSLADRAGVGRYSEPKHGVIGDPVRDNIYRLDSVLEQQAPFSEVELTKIIKDNMLAQPSGLMSGWNEDHIVTSDGVRALCKFDWLRL